jgi:putative transposase
VGAPNAVHHVYNRGNRKAVIFHKRDDYRAFFSILEEAQERFRMRMLSFCVMRNHWHLVLWPDERVSISTYMHWVTTTHVQRYHAHYGLRGTGHLYQDRFQNPICRDHRGVLAVMRYVEANPLTAHLVQRAEDWEWSSLRLRLDGDEGNLLAPGPVPLPPNWRTIVNETRPKHITAAHRACQPRKRVETPKGGDATPVG